ncbi:MAG TPA: hypothetical protein VLG28_01590 [Acidimicrobiia bacterium]|jgi:hypothetical protein|nr:hypothetical protein [Acidimicrobiia bacterium]
MKLRNTIAGVGAAAAVLAGSVLVAVPAIAQDDADDGVTEDTTVEERHHHRGGAKFTAIAEVLGIDLDELRDRLESDETIADIASAQGVTVDDVIAALMGDAQERLADAVDDERLMQDEADERLVEIEERITGFVNGEIQLGRGGFGGSRGFGPGLEAATNLLGLDSSEITAQLQDGATLADLAEQQGVSVNELTAAMVAPAAEHLADHVEGGELTQYEADERLTRITERIEAMVNGDEPLGEQGFGRRSGGHRGGGFGPGANAVESATTNA